MVKYKQHPDGDSAVTNSTLIMGQLCLRIYRKYPLLLFSKSKLYRYPATLKLLGPTCL